MFIYLFQSRTSVYFLFLSTLIVLKKKYLVNSLKFFIFGSILITSHLIIDYKQKNIIKNVDKEILALEEKIQK